MGDRLIEDIFIHAAEVDRKLPDTARPARLKSQHLPYVHDAADQNGWGGTRYQEERAAFWDGLTTRLKASEISDWEQCNTLILCIDDESERRCLWRWAMAKAGGQPFSLWCRSENIHVETGRRRKDRAIRKITVYLSRKGLLNNENACFDLLPVDPQISHIEGKVGEGHDDKTRALTWRDDEALTSVSIPQLRDFSWADKRNEIRRQREANKRKAA